MENLLIDATGSSPRVDFNFGTGELKLSGESYPENALEFYRPLLAWLEAFLERADRPVRMELNLSYLNTSSIKSLMDMLDELEEEHRSGRNVSVTWFYDEENDRALELAEEFREDLPLPFFLVPVRN